MLILFLVGAVDYETATSHALTVTVTDTGSVNSVVLDVIIVVNNINEGSPSFTNLPGAQTINENLPIGSSVFDLTATGIE